MIRIETGSRLHFGLFNIGADKAWENIDREFKLPARRFGGVGLMVDSPGISLAVEPAPAWSASGPLANRTLEFARRFAASLVAEELSPQRLTISRAPPEHAGLGTGTQLGLAVAEALAIAAGHTGWSPIDLAARVGRGHRSGIGVHGYRNGGLIVDGGKRAGELSTLLLREAFPSEWRAVLLLPPIGPGMHGQWEIEKFDRLQLMPTFAGRMNALCRLVLLGMIPALRERDCQTFGESLYDYNAHVGELFAAEQCGRYSHPVIGELIGFVRKLGIAGVGQSSWGPAVFAVTESAERATHVADAARKRYGGNMMVWVTAARGTPV